MVNKKYVFSLALMLGCSFSLYAQSKLWDWNDKNVVPEKSQKQYKDFVDNKNPFPPAPRSAWELSLGGGPTFIKGDVASKLGYGGSISLRKAITNSFSVRFGYQGSFDAGKGATYSYKNDDARVTAYLSQPGTAVSFPFPSYGSTKIQTNDYQAQTHMATLDFIASINTISNFRGDPKINIYALGGVDLITTKVRYIHPLTNSWTWLNDFDKRSLYFNKGHNMWLLAYSFGGGLSYKINKKYNIGFEERVTQCFTDADYLDGFKSDLVRGKDTYFYSAVKLNINLLK